MPRASSAGPCPDLVIWDNLATMHRATPFEDARYRRELRRVTTLDVPATA